MRRISMKSFCCHVCLKNHPSLAIAQHCANRMLPLWPLNLHIFMKRLKLENYHWIIYWPSELKYIPYVEGETERKRENPNEHPKKTQWKGFFTFQPYSSWVILTNHITAKWSFDRKEKEKFNKQNHFATHHEKM